MLKTLSICKAAAYTIANWDRLSRFTKDPQIPLDNNATERAIRGPVVGRKNHYGLKSSAGTQIAATLHTLVETAKLRHRRAHPLSARSGALKWTRSFGPEAGWPLRAEITAFCLEEVRVS